MSPLPRLPIEICELIIQQLALDPKFPHRQALEACSLTCKTFLPKSTSLLFRFVSLDGEDQGKRLLKVVSSPHAKAVGLASYVRYLDIDDGGNNWVYQIAPQLADVLLEVTNLTINNLAWRYLSSTTQTAFFTGFLKVSTLSLNHLTFGPSADLDHLISSFPSLVKLKLQGVLCNVWKSPGIVAPKSLRAMTISPFYSSYASGLVKSGTDISSRGFRVEFTRMYPKSAYKMNKFLELLGSNLHRLKLEFCIKSHSPFFQAPDLSFNDQLRTISIIYGIRWVGEMSTSMNWFTHVFSHIEPAHITRVKIRFRLYEDYDVSDVNMKIIDWRQVENIFTRPDWDKLSRVDVGFIYKPSSFWLKVNFDVIKACLPALAYRGILFPIEN